MLNSNNVNTGLLEVRSGVILVDMIQYVYGMYHWMTNRIFKVKFSFLWVKGFTSCTCLLFTLQISVVFVFNFMISIHHSYEIIQFSNCKNVSY